MYIYICIYIYGRVFGVPTPPPYGSLGSTPFPSICKLLAAFLRSSLVFARSLQPFWLPAWHLLGTCYLLDDLRSTHTPSKYLRGSLWSYIHVLCLYFPIYYLCTLTTLHVFNIYRTYHTLQWYHTLQGAKKNDQVDLLIQYHTQQTYISYIPYLPSTQYQPFMHTFHTYHTYQTYHTFQTCHTRPAIHTIHTQQHTIPHPHHTTAGEGHYYGRPMTMAEGGVGTLDYIIIIYI